MALLAQVRTMTGGRCGRRRAGRIGACAQRVVSIACRGRALGVERPDPVCSLCDAQRSAMTGTPQIPVLDCLRHAGRRSCVVVPRSAPPTITGVIRGRHRHLPAVSARLLIAHDDNQGHTATCNLVLEDAPAVGPPLTIAQTSGVVQLVGEDGQRGVVAPDAPSAADLAAGGHP
jgi:hypothetical protein